MQKYSHLWNCLTVYNFKCFCVLSSDRQSIISPSSVDFFAPPVCCAYGEASLQMYLNILSNKSVFIIYKNGASEIQA